MGNCCSGRPANTTRAGYTNLNTTRVDYTNLNTTRAGYTNLNTARVDYTSDPCHNLHQQYKR